MAGPLGCPSTYTVGFHDRNGQTPFGDVVRPSSLEWSRVLDDTSQAKIIVPLAGPECCGTLRDVEPWCHDMSVYRDEQMVWQGPVTYTRTNRTQAEVIARDVTAWLDHRNIGALLDYTPTGAGQADLSAIAEAIVRDALAPDDPNVLPYLLVIPSGVLGERKYEPPAVKAGDELRELAKTGVDFTALGRRIIVAGEMPLARLPQLHDGHFLGDLDVIKDGLGAATRAVVAGEGVIGTAGGAGPCGLLTAVVKADSIRDQASADAEAAAIVAAGSPTPLILDVPDGAQLAPDTPVGIMDLVPGVIVPVAATLACTVVHAELRLVRLQVTFTPAQGEQVKITLVPVGVELQSA